MATLTLLRDSARSKADEQNTDFISDTELDRFLNQGARYIHGKIAQRFTDGLVVKGTAGNSGVFDTVIGTQSYALPAALKKLVRVEARPDGSSDDNAWRGVRRVNIGNDRGDSYYPVREGYLPWFGYFTTDGYIHFRPVPSQVFEVRLWFVPRFTAMSAVSDEPVLPEEFHEMIAEYAAIQCLRKSGEGIFRESMEIFNIELENLLSTIDYPVQEPEVMLITQDEDYERS